jgi:hypothetical protein
MDVYLVPIGRDRFECYYEAADDEEPEAAAPHAGVLGFFSRLKARFSQQLREAEQARHELPRDEPNTTMARLQRRMMRWIAERVAEQRLLWHLGRAKTATLHTPDNLEAASATKLMRASMQRDADRHLRLLAVHSLALLVSIPVALIPGPNFLGYLFTFTVVGHFLAWRGARRGLNGVAWTLAPNTDLADLGQAFALGDEARRHRIHEVADRLRLPRLAKFVERMAAPVA